MKKPVELTYEEQELTMEEQAGLARALMLGHMPGGKCPDTIFEPGGFFTMVDEIRRAMSWLKNQKNMMLRTQRVLELLKDNGLVIAFGPEKDPSYPEQKKMHIQRIPIE
jgi:hypothetical protein